ncbi:MAG: chloride channel protein [Thermomicrobiales bacterium]|nr:chloride channel protein [Thermomicrobiales bacterium]
MAQQSDDPEDSRRMRAIHWLNWALFRRLLPRSSGFESTRYLGKWLLLGIAVGIVAGLGSVLFYRALEFATQVFLGDIVGYTPPLPVGEGSPVREAMDRPWLLPVVTGLGGLLSGLIVFTLAPEAEGHGTDAAIEAIHYKQGRLRARVPPIKLIASAITIGSGGSGGREGPAAQISAGFGSILGLWLKLDAQDRRILVAAGMGAGIGAIFRAPLGGALMAAEILYLHDLEVEALIPSLIASIVGYSVFGSFEGFTPIFGAQPGIAFGNPLTLGYYALLGLLCGAVGILYARTFYGVTGVFHRFHIPRFLKPMLGGVLVGLMGLAVTGSLHTGYGWIQISMTDELKTLPLWLVLALPFAKILATSLSIGSGGSGGIFGPGMVIGGMLGAAFWRIGDGFLPLLPTSPAPFVIVGMMALFGGIAHAPLAVMLMVAEMTGNLSLLAPAMVAIALATLLIGDTTIYTSQLPNRASSPAHRLRFSFPLLSSLFVRDAMSPVSFGQSWSQTESAASLEPDQSLDSALELLVEGGVSTIPVVDQGVVVGQITHRDIVATYKAMLARGVHRARSLPEETALFEVRLGPTSPLVGRTLRDGGMPRGTLVVSIIRSGETIFPSAATELEADDVVMVVASPESEAGLRSFLAGDEATNDDGEA